MSDKALRTSALAAGLAAPAASLFALALPGPALAQNLTLYVRIGFQGRAFGRDAPLANFDRIGPSPGYRPTWGSHRSAICYSEPDFGGRQFVIEGDSGRNLDRSGFNDRARSLRIERGDWIFCSDRDFGGTCRTFGPGDYANLPGDLDRTISSARRLRGRYAPATRPDGLR